LHDCGHLARTQLDRTRQPPATPGLQHHLGRIGHLIFQRRILIARRQLLVPAGSPMIVIERIRLRAVIRPTSARIARCCDIADRVTGIRDASWVTVRSPGASSCSSRRRVDSAATSSMSGTRKYVSDR
jgi:hypothetical protein